MPASAGARCAHPRCRDSVNYRWNKDWRAGHFERADPPRASKPALERAAARLHEPHLWHHLAARWWQGSSRKAIEGMQPTHKHGSTPKALSRGPLGWRPLRAGGASGIYR